jgi:hypothetical protein
VAELSVGRCRALYLEQPSFSSWSVWFGFVSYPVVSVFSRASRLATSELFI